ncbi:MAG TPA: hypothetical protein VJC05_03490 [Candidatus Andersenbacteria bacterium]|nr:hypothetical protein [Candidatus Andersenbacteria bacterium]
MSNETPGAAAEHQETLPAKHQMTVETEVTDTTKERGEFLQVASGIGNEPLDPTREQQYRDEAHAMLRQWRESFPAHESILSEVEEKDNLFTVVVEAWENGDRDKLHRLQGFIKDGLRAYGDGWETLSERDKRAVRTLEMAGIMSDVMKHGIDQKKNRFNKEAAQKLVGIMEWYEDSVDLPTEFREEFLKKGVATIREDIEIAPPTPSATSPKPHRTPAPSPQESRPQESSEEDVIDMEYNQQTASYESAEELRQRPAKPAPPAPRRLEHTPGPETPPASAAPPAPAAPSPPAGG